MSPGPAEPGRGLTALGLLLLALPGPARAEPMGSLHLLAAPAPAGQERLGAAGVGGALGWGADRLGAELAADLGLGPAGALISLGPRLRLSPLPDGALWVVTGLAARIQAGPAAAGSLGLELDLPTAGLRPRLGAAYHVDHRLRSRGAHLSLGLAWPPRRAASPAPVPPPSEPASAEPPSPVAPEPRPANPLAALPDDATLWVPHPICELLPVREAEALLADLPAGSPVWIHADGRLPVLVQSPLEDPLPPLAEAPEQGSLLIIAWQGDEVRLEGTPVSLSHDAIAMVRTGVGPARVEITGGGRHHEVELAVSDGHATYVRIPRPAERRVLFPIGSAELSATARAELEQVAAQLGGWSLHAIGSHSPEGSAALNAQLATQRAQAVVEQLQSLGIDASRLRQSSADEPQPELPAAQQRAVRLLPVPPRESP